jgi:hypothetical protein
MSFITLLRNAAAERNANGFLSRATREQLEDLGFDAADIESSLIKIEGSN